MRFLLTIIAAVLYVIGWVAGKVSLMVGWAWSAVSVGWDDARRQLVKAT